MFLRHNKNVSDVNKNVKEWQGVAAWIVSIIFLKISLVMNDYFMNTTEYVRHTYTWRVFSAIFRICWSDWLLTEICELYKWWV